MQANSEMIVHFRGNMHASFFKEKKTGCEIENLVDITTISGRQADTFQTACTLPKVLSRNGSNKCFKTHCMSVHIV